MPKIHIQIKNWGEHQHYKDRNPPWIKLHVKILNDMSFMMLAPASKCLLLLLWVLAAENNGEINFSEEELKFRLRDSKFSRDSLTPLIHSGFISVLADASSDLARAPKSCSETETETETDACAPASGELDEFGEFWKAYPKKIGKQAAVRAWQKIKIRPPLEKILDAIKRAQSTDQWQKDNGEFIPHPSTWLNGGRWDDEPLTRIQPSKPSGHMKVVL